MRMEMGRDGASVTLLLDPASAMDVAALVVDGVDLSPGHAIPSDGDPRIDQALKGFLFTCGPDHIRHPEPMHNGGSYPLHGSLAGTPILQETLVAAEKSCLATTVIPLADGGRARLTRRWSVSDGNASVHLEDRIENIGESSFAPMWMYHINIAGRLFDDFTRISGEMIPDRAQDWRFGLCESAHVLHPAEAADGWAEVSVGPFAKLSGRVLTVRFRTATLPFLQMWRCQKGDANVVSIEPVSHRIARRPTLLENGELTSLAPGETIGYELALAISHTPLPDGT